MNMLSQIIAGLAWVSIILQLWLFLLRRIDSDLLSWIIFIFFLLIAVVASSITRQK